MRKMKTCPRVKIFEFGVLDLQTPIHAPEPQVKCFFFFPLLILIPSSSVPNIVCFRT